MRRRHAIVSLLLGALSLAMIPAVSCGPSRHRLDYWSAPSEALGRKMNFGVYLPPRFDGRDHLPLVVFLHGGGDNERSFERYGADVVLDDWIGRGKLRPFIMVIPDGEMGFWTNWYDGSRRYEDYVVEDVVSFVRKTYPVRTRREDTHLMGVSMGGSGTIFMALNHLDVFGSAGVLSAPLYNDRQVEEMLGGNVLFKIIGVDRIFGPAEPRRIARKSLYQRVRAAEDLGGLQLLIGAGRDDSEKIRGTTAAYHDHLESRSVPHRYLTYRGGHTWHDWKKIFPVVLCYHLADDCALESDAFYDLREI